MSAAIRYRATARREYEASIRYFEQQRPGLGLEFEAEVEICVATVSLHPDRFPFSAGTVRVASVDRFPYCVYYRIRGGMVIIVAVYHQSRDPDGWKTRR